MYISKFSISKITDVSSLNILSFIPNETFSGVANATETPCFSFGLVIFQFIKFSITAELCWVLIWKDIINKIQFYSW